MPRSVKASRVQAEVTLTASDNPASSGDSVTFAVTGIPARGIVHRTALILGSSAAWASTADAGGIYAHTTGAAGAGATLLTSAQAQTIIAQAAVDPDFANAGGGQLALGSSIYVWAASLDFGGASSQVTTQTNYDNSGHPGFYYDVSGTTLGPNGTGTLYFTWIGSGGLNFTTNAIFSKFRLEIEPCT